VRVFPPAFVGGVVKLFHAMIAGDRDGEAEAYRAWGFKGLTGDLMDVLGIWARFIYGPLLDDRVRTVADGVSPGQYGRREAFQVKRALEEKGPVTIPREFVFMDRAAIGLGAAFLAGLGAGLWESTAELASSRQTSGVFAPAACDTGALKRWHDAVQRSLHWSDR